MVIADPRSPGPRGDAAMRNRPGLLPFVALILATPPLIAALAGTAPGRDLAAVELLVAVGLGYAAWRRGVSGRDLAAPPPGSPTGWGARRGADNRAPGGPAARRPFEPLTDRARLAGLVLALLALALAGRRAAEMAREWGRPPEPIARHRAAGPTCSRALDADDRRIIRPEPRRLHAAVFVRARGEPRPGQ